LLNQKNDIVLHTKGVKESLHALEEYID